MSRETLLQSSFNAGALSPRLFGRTDFKKYGSAVAQLSNQIGLVSGPTVFRPGTVYINTVEDETKVSRLIPFKYNTTQTYQLEFADNKIRFFKDRGLILSQTSFANGGFASSLAGWTNVSSGTGTATQGGSAAILNGGAAGIGAIYQGLTYIGVEQYTITANVTVANISVKIGTTIGGTEIGTGTLVVGVGSTVTFQSPTAETAVYVQFENAANSAATLDGVTLSTPAYSIDSPYAEADLPSISYSQDADVLYLAFGSDTVKTRTLQRYDHAQWQLLEMDFRDGPYLDANTSSLTLTPGAATGNTTLTASAALFASTDVGRLFRYRKDTSSAWGWGTITAFTSTTVVDITIESGLGGTTASTEWRLGAFSETTGYPALVTLHEQRMVFANTRTKPNFYWMSESQGYGQNRILFSPSASTGTVTDANSIYGPLSAGDVSTILWLSSGNILAVGTADSEWVIESGDTSKALSPTNTRANRRTNHGSKANVRAVRIDGTVMFAKGTGHKVNRFVFNYSKDQYDALNLSELAEHYFMDKQIEDLVYAPEPFSVVWARMDDGTLNALTFVDSEEVGGWSTHTIGGAFGDGNAVVESLSVIPAQDASYSELWMIVKRTIDGATHRYIEVMEKPFFQANKEDAVYVDCALKYEGAAATTITGLDHLEGEEVYILADGANHPTRTVSGGEITLNTAAETVIVGLYYEGDGETLDFDAVNSFNGSSMGQIRRITEVQLRLFETGLIYMGRSDQEDSDLNLVEPRTSSDFMDSGPALKSGVYDVETESSWELSSRLRWQFRSPMPGTISAIMYKAMVNEG